MIEHILSELVIDWLTCCRTTIRYVRQIRKSTASLSDYLDIVKVRLQTTTQYANAFDCASKIFKNEGPAAFYKGTLTPLIGIGACVSGIYT